MSASPPLSQRLDQTTFDVIVVGAGAVGASAAQHLAARGFTTLLVDQGDFASGTSSRSSRLLYCGLSYLAPDYPLWQLLLRPRDLIERLRMARMSMRCRRELVETMPERVKPVDFVFPVQRASRYPGWKVALGYRFLSLFASRSAPLAYRRERATTERSRRGLAGQLDRRRLTHVAHFREYQYDWAERICIDTILDAERLGAVVANYVRVDGLKQTGDRWQATLSDTRAGASAAPAAVQARYVVNAAGPWVDDLWSRSDSAPMRQVIGIKGINLVVKLPEDCRGQGLETMNSLNQPFYVMPWGEHHFLGPTETVFEGDPNDARVLPDEIDFVLGEANRVFPELDLGPEDVVYSWCGIRPGTAASTRERMRALALYERDTGIGGAPAVTVTGAPIMVHRRAGREVAACVSRRLQPSRPSQRLSYAARPLPSDDGPRIVGVPIAALRAAAEHEHVQTLADLMFRRVNLGWQADMGLGHAREIADSIADVMGWCEADVVAEVVAYETHVREHFSPCFAAPARDSVHQTKSA